MTQDEKQIAKTQALVDAIEDAALTALSAWFDRNKIVNSGAAFLDEALGPIFNDEGGPVDPYHIAMEVARAIKTRAHKAVPLPAAPLSGRVVK